MSKTIKNTTSATAMLSFGEAGDYQVAVGDLPLAVQHTLMQRTYSHIMGNEAAAVRARLAAEINPDKSAKYNDAELAVAIHDWRVAKLNAMIAGEFSLRVVGPRLTDDEKARREIARDQIIARMAELKRPMPKASDKTAWETAVDKYLATPELAAKVEAEIERRKGFKAPAFDVEAMFG